MKKYEYVRDQHSDRAEWIERDMTTWEALEVGRKRGNWEGVSVVIFVWLVCFIFKTWASTP